MSRPRFWENPRLARTQTLPDIGRFVGRFLLHLAEGPRIEGARPVSKSHLRKYMLAEGARSLPLISGRNISLLFLSGIKHANVGTALSGFMDDLVFYLQRLASWVHGYVMDFKISTWRSVGKLVMLLVRFSQAERFRENLLCYSDRIDGESISNLPLL